MVLSIYTLYTNRTHAKSDGPQVMVTLVTIVAAEGVTPLASGARARGGDEGSCRVAAAGRRR
eukprot:7068328-Prymnesium_polylepis.1